MRALPDVLTATFHIPSETFTVDLTEQGQSAAVLAAIRKLGYEPTLLDQPPPGTARTARINAPTSAPLQAALARAQERGVPLVVYLGGSYCSACKRFEQQVLADARVQSALEAFEFLLVDVASDKDTTADLGVKAVPDLWILSGDRSVRARENRSLSADEFRAVLGRHAPR